METASAGSDIFETFFGGGGSTRGPRSRKERGQDALLRVEVDLDEVIFGTHREVDVDVHPHVVVTRESRRALVPAS